MARGSALARNALRLYRLLARKRTLQRPFPIQPTDVTLTRKPGIDSRPGKYVPCCTAVESIALIVDSCAHE